jgi:hypothetical protein
MATTTFLIQNPNGPKAAKFSILGGTGPAPVYVGVGYQNELPVNDGEVWGLQLIEHSAIAQAGGGPGEPMDV